MYNVDYQELAEDNGIPIHENLIVGEAIVIINNDEIKRYRDIEVNGFTFPNIDKNTLIKTLPYLTYLSIFSYSIKSNGDLNTIKDDELIASALNNKVMPVMVITNIGLENKFDSDLAHTILNNTAIQDKLINNVLTIMNEKGYQGIDVDFEYVYPEDKNKYIEFLKKVKLSIKPYNYFMIVAVAPKTSDDQKGLLYEAHDYRQIGDIADHVVIMTYEWGYSGGPAMAVSPIDSVMNVLDYAVTRIPSNKILMGIPTYGYDWTLPYTKGNIAESIDNSEAFDIARYYHQSISYNYDDQAPYFNYFDSDNRKHEVWFDDARSIQSKLQLPIKYNLGGISYWTINRYFKQNFLILNSMFNIKKSPK